MVVLCPIVNVIFFFFSYNLVELDCVWAVLRPCAVGGGERTPPLCSPLLAMESFVVVGVKSHFDFRCL